MFMKTPVMILCAIAVALSSVNLALAAPYGGWKRDYSGKETETLLLWKFDGEYTAGDRSSAALADSSRFRRNAVPPSGATVSVGSGVTGKWGGGLRIADADTTLVSSRLAGSGSTSQALGKAATSVEVWFQPLTEKLNGSYLFDKKYAGNSGAAIRFAVRGKNRFVAEVGNGSSSLQVVSKDTTLEPGKWYHIALTYSADTGELALFLNGQVLQSAVHPSFGELDPGKYNWSVGNRIGPSYVAAPGVYDNFRVSSVAYDFADVAPGEAPADTVAKAPAGSATVVAAATEGAAAANGGLRMAPAVLAAQAAAAAAEPVSELVRRSPEHFFRPSVIPDLPEDVLYPKGKEMFFSFYSTAGGKLNQTREAPDEDVLNPIFERFRKAGVKLIGPQYELNSRILADAQKHGFGAIYTVGIPMKFLSKEPLKLTPEEIKAEISRQVKEVVDNDLIKVWYITPEELRYWRKDEVAYLVAAAEAVRESDPKGRPIFFYDPGHRNAEAMTWVANEMDYLAKGAYTNYAKMKEQRIYSRWSVEEEIEAFKLAGKEDGVALLVPEMFEEPPAAEHDLIPTWVRHDVYLGLVSGGKGVLVFSARMRANFPSHETYLQSYFDVLEDLVGPKNLSQVFLFGEKRHDVTVDVLEGPETVSMVYPGARINEPLGYPSVSVLDVAYGEDRYLFLVNSANEPVSAMVGGISYNSARAHALFSDEPSFVIGEGEFEVDLQPLEVKGFRFTREK